MAHKNKRLNEATGLVAALIKTADRLKADEELTLDMGCFYRLINDELPQAQVLRAFDECNTAACFAGHAFVQEYMPMFGLEEFGVSVWVHQAQKVLDAVISTYNHDSWHRLFSPTTYLDMHRAETLSRIMGELQLMKTELAGMK